MTKKLFYEDSYIQEFSAVVTECRETEKGFLIVLDQSAFFPEGGGQYADTGWLDETKVTDVQERDEILFHETEQAFQEGQTVTGRIDWEERFMKMQQHTGEHIVSGLVHEAFGYQNVGFHLGSEDCTMDFNGELTKEQLRKIEWKANQAVFANLDVEVSYPAKDVLEHMEYRSKIEIDGQVRIVTIPGYDVCACCAPHVKKTGEIGLIKLTNVQRYKGGVRVTMLCGVRALADYDQKGDAAKAISAALCAKEGEITEAVQHLKEECEELRRKLAEQQKEILSGKAERVPDETQDVCLFEMELEGDAPRTLMNYVLDKGHRMCAVFTGSPADGYRYVIGSRALNMREIAGDLNARFEGRGGGKPEMIQGSLHGTEEELTQWIQEKVRTLEHE